MTSDEVLRAAGRLVASGVDPAPFLAMLGPSARLVREQALLSVRPGQVVTLEPGLMIHLSGVATRPVVIRVFAEEESCVGVPTPGMPGAEGHVRHVAESLGAEREAEYVQAATGEAYAEVEATGWCPCGESPVGECPRCDPEKPACCERHKHYLGGRCGNK